MSSSPARPIHVLIALALALTAACSGGGKKATASAPAGGQLLQQSAGVLRTVTSLSFTLRTSGDPNVNVKSVDANLLRNGNSKGSVQVTQLGMALQLDFVVLGKTVHFKGVTGGWQTQPLSTVASIYDPSAILDPDRGLVNLLSTATGAATRGREKVAGQDCYQVHATLTKDALARLVPGMSVDAPADIWVGVTDHRLLKMEIQAPPKSGDKPGKVTVTFADYNKQFTITAPAG